MLAVVGAIPGPPGRLIGNIGVHGRLVKGGGERVVLQERVKDLLETPFLLVIVFVAGVCLEAFIFAVGGSK